MDALLDPSLNLLAVSEDSITLQGCRADMLTIRRALRMAPAAREGWQPIETAPKSGFFCWAISMNPVSGALYAANGFAKRKLTTSGSSRKRGVPDGTKPA